MGKIRIKTFDEAGEDEAKKKAKKEARAAESKRAKKAAKKALKASKVTVVDETETVVTPEETIETPEVTVETPEETVETTDEIVITPGAEDFESSLKGAEGNETTSEEKPKKAKKEKFARAAESKRAKAAQKVDSKRHKENLTFVSKTATYTLPQALEALKKFKKSKFDETVELHINTKEKGVSGQATLPHGTGKTLRIKVADDATISEVEKGKINFDVLVAHPSMMPKLAKVARVLGPRGLMPNPKNGTITDKPEEAVKKLSGGQISYKTESAAPIIHTIVGKVSFEDKKLSENITTLLSSIGTANIKSATLKSTMSPGIRLKTA